ncbi:MAG: hypothetical protein BWY26_00817 [Elusimicrobia bacterium ADurb.Bin231]|nr:MAG: hypothetical protein BWY26_00817 [Elusimicrobia bacterium ADurb.Bin231]
MTLKLSHEINNVILIFLAVCGVAVLIYILQHQRKIVFGARHIKWPFRRRKGKKYKKKSGTKSKWTKSNKKL